MASSLPPGIDLATIPSLPPPPGVLSNFIDPETLGTSIVAVSATTSVLALILLSIRLFSTFRVTRSASYDDGMIILAMMCSLTYIGLIVHTKELARHSWDLPISEYTSSYFKIIFAETIVAAIGFLFAKSSILFLSFRLFSPTRSFGWFVYIGIAWATIICLVSVAVAGALCAPRSGESFGSMTVAKRCTHEDVWAVVQGSLTVPLDFYILYLPIPMVWNLQLSLRKRVGVIAIFMTGFM